MKYKNAMITIKNKADHGMVKSSINYKLMAAKNDNKLDFGKVEDDESFIQPESIHPGILPTPTQSTVPESPTTKKELLIFRYEI